MCLDFPAGNRLPAGNESAHEKLAEDFPRGKLISRGEEWSGWGNESGPNPGWGSARLLCACLWSGYFFSA